MNNNSLLELGHDVLYIKGYIKSHREVDLKVTVITAVLMSVILVRGETVPLRVTADRVNLRAGPALSAETVGSVEYEQELTALELGTNWVRIVPPPGIDFWVHRDFLVDGRVNAKKLNVRAGPGVNYKITGTLLRGDRPEIRGEFSEWIKIAPPQNSSVWISRDFVEEVRPGNREAMGVVNPHEKYRYSLEPVSSRPAIQETRNTQTARSSDGRSVQHVQQRPKPKLKRTIALPSDWKLIPLEGQGKTVELEGQLKTVGFMIKRPTKHRLVSTTGGRNEMLCYVRGNSDQLDGFTGRKMRIKGREYWVQGYRYPVVVVEKMALLE